MADAQKIEPCDVCGGAGGLESFEMPAIVHALTPEGYPKLETRWRVKCARCGHMTPHFGAASLALAVWNERTGQREDKLAG